MFDTTQQAQNPSEAQNSNDAQSGTEQQSRFDTDIFFDPKSEIYHEEEDYEPIYQENKKVDQQEQESPENLLASAEQSQEIDDDDDIDFDGTGSQEDNNASSENQNAPMTKEQMIEALKKEGLNVSEAKPENVNAERTSKLEHLENKLSNIDNFLAQTNEVIVREHVKGEILKEYRLAGKENNINKEDLQLEIDAQFDEISQNPTMLKMYAENVKRDIADIRRNTEDEKNLINKEINDEQSSIINENRSKLKTSLSQIVKDGFLNSMVSKDEVKEVYNEIISGEFTEKINSNPELVAKFGIFLKKEAQISEALGKPTYGQGVKDAFDQLQGKSRTETSSVANAMTSRSGNGQEVRDTNNRFESNVVASDPNARSKFVAGKGIMY